MHRELVVKKLPEAEAEWEGEGDTDVDAESKYYMYYTCYR